MLITSLFVTENIKCGYGFSVRSKGTFWYQNHLFVFFLILFVCLFCLAAAAASMPSEQSRILWHQFLWWYVRKRINPWYSLGTVNPNPRVHCSLWKTFPLERLTLWLGFYCLQWTTIMDSNYQMHMQTFVNTIAPATPILCVSRCQWGWG